MNGDLRIVGKHELAFNGRSWNRIRTFANEIDAKVYANSIGVPHFSSNEAASIGIEVDDGDDDLAKVARRGLIQDALCIDLIRLGVYGPHLGGPYDPEALPPDISDATDEEKADAWSDFVEQIQEIQKAAKQKALARLAKRVDARKVKLESDRIVELAKRLNR